MGSLRVFLSYAREDAAQVQQLYDRLKAAGFQPWMDVHDLIPGQHWRDTILKTLRRADAVVLCLSPRSVGKRSFLQHELREALDVAKERLLGDIYIIPLRLEHCEIPEELKDYHWVDSFMQGGFDKLVLALEAQAKRLAASHEPMLASPTALSIEKMERPSNPITELSSSRKSCSASSCRSTHTSRAHRTRISGGER